MAREHHVYTLLVQTGRSPDDGLPDGATCPVPYLRVEAVRPALADAATVVIALGVAVLAFRSVAR